MIRKYSILVTHLIEFQLEKGTNYFGQIYKCISKNDNVVEKFIYFSNSTQIVKLVYLLNSMHTDWSSLSLWFF